MLKNERPARPLFFLGFLTLFLELVLIRYLTGNIWNLGYFPNLVLLAVFLGMGVGFSIHQYFSPEESALWFRRSVFGLLALVAFASLGNPTFPGFAGNSGEFGSELFFTSRSSKPLLLSLAMFVLWFFGTMAIFVFLSQRTAKVFAQFLPLRAYTLDILGSCAGILTFMAMSWFQVPAWFWMLLLIPLFVLSGGTQWAKPAVARAPVLALAVCAALSYANDLKMFARSDVRNVAVRWSPYQKVKYVSRTTKPHELIANGIPHQEMLSLKDIRSLFYQVPYNNRADRPELPQYKRILILGAGSGNDVAAALSNGVDHVDAVEIDPVLADFGKIHHPAKPYDDPRVRLTIDDGRAFMVRARDKYDLIVFALTDSLAKVSSLGQLRLENYLFTEQSIQAAQRLLSEHGDLVFYNFYRREWLTEKIEHLLYKGSGNYPVRLWQEADFTVLAAGRNNRQDFGAATPASPFETPTDDWPFLYLKERTIPGVYLGAMGVVTLLLIGFMTFLNRQGGARPGKGAGLATKLAFVLMGVAFLLLETKSIIQFALLFGTTWVNSSLVFLGVLLLVLAANWTAALMNKKWMGALFVLLMASCLVPFVIPLSRLLAIESTALRYVAASFMTFLPIYFANLIFSLNFRDQKIAEHIFGWNLLGAGLGGILEYASLATGYRSLAVVVVVCYGVVFLLLKTKSAPATLSASGLAVKQPAS
jgi:hypothetical protein